MLNFRKNGNFNYFVKSILSDIFIFYILKIKRRENFLVYGDVCNNLQIKIECMMCILSCYCAHTRFGFDGLVCHHQITVISIISFPATCPYVCVSFVMCTCFCKALNYSLLMTIVICLYLDNF